MSGPLEGLKVIELAGFGSAPYAGMLLADLGAEILLVDKTVQQERSAEYRPREFYFQHRGHRSVAIDLETDEGSAVLLRLLKHADVLIDPYQPGVTERLGIGPDEALAVNERLIYARVSGWGQDGLFASRAGHDINWAAFSGALFHIRRSPRDIPALPVGLLADFGGGGMLLAIGILAAVYEVARSGKGQVVDAAVIDGATSLATSLYAQAASSSKLRMSNEDSGHYYQIYETADRNYISIGAVETEYYQELLDAMGLSEDEMPLERDRAAWPALREKFAAIFRTKTRDEWCALLEHGNTCFSPVLSPAEAPQHPHNQSRNSFVEIAGKVQPAPAPRFSRSKTSTPTPPPQPGADTVQVLTAWGFSDHEIADLLRSGIAAGPTNND